MTLRPDAILGDYRLQTRLGQGGMGTVFRAQHRRLGRTVALKVLRDSSLASRFLNEARIQAGLQHPNIATLYDYFEADGKACIAMELIEGQTFDEYLRQRGPLPFREALRLFQPVVEAVAYLHAHGVIHRDLKSHNVKVTPEGRVALLDFGIAKNLSLKGLTTGDAVPGTPEYLSPEQVHGRPPDARSDVWALGVLFYELLTRDMPFRAESTFTLFERITRGAYDPPSSRVRSVPPEADALVARCLRPAPDERYANAGALLKALPRASTRTPAPQTPPARRPARASFSLPPQARMWAAWAFAGLAILALAIVAVQERQPAAPPVEPQEVIQRPAVPPGATPTEIVIDAIGPPAEVYRNGQLLGTTPLTLATYVGEPVDVELRRGTAVEPLQFQTTPGKRAYTVTLPTP
ncbi:MAG: protein kinase [Bacteroidota bacterium]